MSARTATVGLVYAKELRESLRDRRTLIVVVVLPLALYPLMGIGLSQWLGVHELQRAATSSRVELQGPRWPQLEQALRRGEKIELMRREGEQGLRRGQTDLVLTVPADVERALGSDGTVRLRLLYDQTGPRSVQARERVQEALSRLTTEIRAQRLERHHLPATLIEPLATTAQGIATARQVKGQELAGVVPLLIVLMVLLGSFYPAIDLTAGEKERGTLETLLAAPVNRLSLVAGKYLVVATLATLTGVLNLLALGLTIGAGFGPALREAGLTVGMPWGALAAAALMLIPAALFFAALMMAVAVHARGFKEAQNLLTPVYLLCTLPAFAAQLPGVELTLLTAMLPVVNIALLIRDLVAGNFRLLPALVAVGTLLGCAFLALRWAAYCFANERLLFSTDPQLGAGPPDARAPAPTPREAGVLFLIVLALFLLVGQPLQAAHPMLGLVVTEWLLIALPVLLFIRLRRLATRSSLAVRSIGLLSIVGAVLAGSSGWYLASALVDLVQERFLPMPPELARAYYEALFGAQRSLVLDLLILAFSPAICEELLFRGVLLQSSLRTMSARRAVLINGVLFGLFHFSVYRFFPTMLLGVALAALVVRSRSIIPAMIFHFLNNASAVLAVRVLGAPASPTQNVEISYPLLAVALLLFVGGIVLVRARRAGATAEPSAPPHR